MPEKKTLSSRPYIKPTKARMVKRKFPFQNWIQRIYNLKKKVSICTIFKKHKIKYQKKNYISRLEQNIIIMLILYFPSSLPASLADSTTSLTLDLGLHCGLVGVPCSQKRLSLHLPCILPTEI